MYSKILTAADRCDTWDADWETRLSEYVRSVGGLSLWEYVRIRPTDTYHELAEHLAAEGGFGIAPVQIERLQVRDTPEDEIKASIRDSLVRHLRHAFLAQTWGEGPYWESRAIGALASWTAMWSARVDLGALRHRLFELGAPLGWLPEDERDGFLLRLVPD
jgi:hypothetical protein